MKEVEGSLLALIHQHLQQAGYSKAATELQLQNGKKFSTPEVSLQDIYKDWIQHPKKNKSKKSLQVANNQGVKVRVPDPESSSESSEDEGKGATAARSKALSNATPQVQQAKERKSKTKPTTKGKTATIVSKSTSGGTTAIGQNKKASSAAPQVQGVVMETSSSSDSEDDPAPPNAAPVTISSNPAAESTESSSDSESDMDTAGQTHTVLANVHALPRTPLLSSSKIARITVPRKAAIVTKPADVEKSESSDSSDSEVIVNQKPAAPPQASQKKSTDVTAAKPQVTKKSILAGPGKVATPTKTPVIAQPLQSSGSSDSSDSEEEPDAKKTAVLIQSSQKKTIAPPTATRTPEAQTPLLAKHGKLATPAKTQPLAAGSSGVSDSSDSEEEPDAKKTANLKSSQKKSLAPTQTPLSAKPGKLVTPAAKPVIAQPLADQSSVNSDSPDSEEEPDAKKTANLRSSQKKSLASTQTPLSAKPGKLVTPAAKPVIAQPLADQSSVNSDSPDSEEELDAKKTANLKSSQKKSLAPTQIPLSAKPGKLVTPAAKPVIAQPLADQSSVNSDSPDSEEEPDAKKTANLRSSQKKSLAPTQIPLSAKPGKLVTPAAKPVIAQPLADQSSVNSDSPDSEEEPDAKKTANLKSSQKKSLAPTQTPLSTKPGKLVTPAAKPVIAHPLVDQSSVNSDSPDSEEEPDAKKTAASIQSPQKKSIAPPTATRTPGTHTPLLAKPGKLSTSAKTPPLSNQSSGSSDSSDSDEEPDAKKTATLQSSQKKSLASSQTPIPYHTISIPGKLVIPAAKPVIAQPLADQSSGSSDSSDSEEEPDAKKTAAPLQSSQKKTLAPSIATRPQWTQTNLAKTGKVVTPAKTQPPSDQSTGSSDFSDSEEELIAKKTAAPLQSSHKKTLALSIATRPPATHTPLLAKTGKVLTPAKTQPPSDQSTGSSDFSESEEELIAKASKKNSRTVLLGKTGNKATPAKMPVVTQMAAVDSSESSNSSDSEEELNNKKTAVPQRASQKKGKDKTENVATPAKMPVITQPPAAESSETWNSSDSEEELNNKNAVPPRSSQKKGKAYLLAKKGNAATPAKIPVVMQPLAAETSETSNSSDSEEELNDKKNAVPPQSPQTKGNAAKGKGNAATPAKTPVVTQPLAEESSETWNSSDSEEELNDKKNAVPPQSPQKKGKAPLLVKKGNAATPTKKPVVIQPATAESSNSSDSEEEQNTLKLNAPLNPTTSKTKAFTTLKLTAKQDYESSDTSEEAKSKSRTLVAQPSIANILETSDTTDIDEIVSPTPAPIRATKGKAVPILAKTVTPSSLKATKSKVSSTAKTPAEAQKIAVTSSDSSDSEEEPGIKSHITPVLAVPTPQKRKRASKIKEVTLPSVDSIKSMKKKTKAEQVTSTQPAPVTGIDSEEETIMALLTGQSPKKNKQKPSKLELKAAASVSMQKNSSVSDLSGENDVGTLALNITTPVPEPMPPTTEKEKKNAKKRKSSSEDGPKKKSKKAKKEGKKEKKKSKSEGGEAGAITPKTKSSKKDKKKLEKSEKKKSSKKKKEKKKKDGEKKVSKKTKKAESVPGSATGISPKPKKKKKIKVDKVD
ncbi:Treacher Collins-Franceschetti syndrome 1 S homeolog isoform X6 [Xenopus laevis]|uniref:Treacher Collins-Franceschetti syndrome 1 S homeolog isoform X6 n=1 Tax=Xenopus laevis TaxID=8355 RepID=A0A8J0UUW3_XENLA|nr:Treacher Collins-Franceschetti syndrome 1 S homeolog isoform X6 [Xenopus laevis]